MESESYVTLCNYGIAIFGVLAILSSFGAWHFSKRVEEEKTLMAANEGKLVPSAEHGLFKVFLQDGRGYGVPIRTSKNGRGVLTITNPEGRIFDLFNENMLTIKRDNTIKVSAKFRNREGEIVAEMINNEWELNTNNFYKRNYSKNALEVIDNEGRVVFNVIIEENEVILQGIFYGKDGSHLTFADSLGSIVMTYNTDGKGPDVRIAPIFRYPSNRYFGERIK